jgi:hypothetical protein
MKLKFGQLFPGDLVVPDYLLTKDSPYGIVASTSNDSSTCHIAWNIRGFICIEFCNQSSLKRLSDAYLSMAS